MAYDFPLTMPTNVKPNRVTVSPLSTVGVSTSPYTLQQQKFKWAGEAWAFKVTYPPMTRDQAEEWLAFFLECQGRYGTFLFGDPAGAVPRGVGGGTPLVDGAGQTVGGYALAVKGCPASTVGWLKKGDYIQVGEGEEAELHKLIRDADSNADGDVTLYFWPALRRSPADEETVVIEGAQGCFSMQSNMNGWDVDVGMEFGIAFDVVESF
ncbi:MAG: hypothetical protein AB7H77_07000 [Bdellovibrionales bacterium]